MRDINARPEPARLAVFDHCVNAGFYLLVVAAAITFCATLWLPRVPAEDALQSSWICIFGAAVCLLLRLAVMVWEDFGDARADKPS
ncbi:hypothetical protein RD110_10380 [Rhodoferax koreense]|uniref:Uncharacterized protein n=1 Tax=Rhodoferax koreensis TaxID=1842727 RepID=A0A1P8JUX1_9BURK|nr:hypothetical protein [Rhodoferax koreense]APW37543.1 hypothetical protein RD110_10380 [Rhodoferax koreense]